MSAKAVERASMWIYQGVWSPLVNWFRVPRAAPQMPAGHEEAARSFHPAPGYLRYVKLSFWIVLVVIDVALTGAWIAIFIRGGTFWALVLAPIFIIAIVVPDVIAYLAIHLHYDTMWYVVTDRALRLRRGVMIVRESTITFENIQNVSIHQGPLQRYFGISNLVVETAGGGGSSAQGQPAAGTAHTGLIEGIENPKEIRDLIMTRVRASKGAGLGDDLDQRAATNRNGWTSEHVGVLREIRDEIAALSSAG